MSPAPRRVWLPWLLLLVPTLLIGGVALRLLWLEQRRIDEAASEVQQRAEVAVRARAQVAADNIELLVAEIRDGLLRELAETPEGDLEALLANWPQTNPLVAQTFLWRPDRATLAWPPADSPERRAFRQRHAALFGGGENSLAAAVQQEQAAANRSQSKDAIPSQVQFDGEVAFSRNTEVAANQALRLDVQKAARSSAAAAKSMPASQARDSYPPSKKIAETSELRRQDARERTRSKLDAERQREAEDKGYAGAPAQSESLFASDIASPPAAVGAPANIAEPPRRNGHAVPLAMDTAAVPWREPASGWLGRNVDGAVFLLGWWQPAGGGAVRGVELNLPAVLERVQALVPTRTEEGGRFAVRGPGESLGNAPIRIPLAATLPGWTLAAWPGAAPRIQSLDVGGGFFVVAALLVGVFVVAIVAGGAMFFRQAAAAAREAALKTSFVSNVSHEMKTPLTTIRMYAEMLADERVDDPAKRARYFSTIGRETARLTRLVNNALDFGRLEAGRKEYHPETIPLGPWFARLVETYAPRAAEADVRLVATPPAAGAAVRCDPDSLDQVALNLIDNGLKYGAAGGVLELHADAVAGGWAVVVADRGPGVPAAHRERIFDRFYRVDDSLTATKQGAGLGLTIARRLARDQGGDLVCHAREGGGAAFVLTLPVATATS
ncbi:MAG TPA: HAMP domain-containing sensor histidine kinase [Opitutaceae bacterium]|nr:HAMP domain-containing sensor histidine kinase [Opitutaceae bacterium]